MFTKAARDIKVDRNDNFALIHVPQPDKISDSEQENQPATLEQALAATHEGVQPDRLVQVQVSPLTKQAHLESPAFSATYASAAHKAFKKHHTLVLKPDDLHLLIVQGISRFFQMYPEDFRTDVVSFNGTRELVHIGELFPGCPAEDWNELPEHFCTAIRENSKNPAFINAIMQDYSLSTPLDRRIKAVTLMATFSPYFTYTELTKCFIPKFRLEGTIKDWEKLAELPDKLLSALAPLSDYALEGDGEGRKKLREWLLKLKQDVLVECCAARQGQANPDFWLSFYKYNSGSGGDRITGYINYFYPIINNVSTQKDNRFVFNQYIWDRRGSAPTPSALPANIVDVDFVWDYVGTKHPMAIKAGFGPVVVDEKIGVSPSRFLSIFHKKTPPRGHQPVKLEITTLASNESKNHHTLALDQVEALSKKVQQYYDARKEKKDKNGKKMEYYNKFQACFPIFFQSTRSRAAKLAASRFFSNILTGKADASQIKNFPALNNGELGELYKEYLQATTSFKK